VGRVMDTHERHVQNCLPLISSCRPPAFLWVYVSEAARYKTTVSMNIQSQPINHHVTPVWKPHRNKSQTNRIATDEASTASGGHCGGTNMTRACLSAVRVKQFAMPRTYCQLILESFKKRCRPLKLWLKPWTLYMNEYVYFNGPIQLNSLKYFPGKKNV
jgi:hypothetical protein